ncbi:MAG TPA: PAS domain-containing protein [Longimicrobium sp.]|nr:PAS domain-containing protein [Longimicrobium sp.]
MPTTLSNPQRLAAITASDLLDTGAIPALDRVVRTAARLLDVPVAQLNVITADRQIPVSHVGGQAWGRAVELTHSFCQHAIRTGEPLVIPDAREHPLVSGSPATRESGIVAYLSVPILSPRAAAPIATLCVVDVRPRDWGRHEVDTLADLAAWARSEIELRAAGLRDRTRAEEAMRDSQARLRAIYDGTYEYIGLISPDGTVLDCNRASLEFAGNTRGDVVGKVFWDTPWFAHTPGAPGRVREGVERAARGEFVREELTLRRPSAEPVTFDFSLHPIRGDDGEVLFIVPEGRDITERERALAARRESEARYRLLFETMDEGFCVIEVIFDDHGQPVDYVFLETNPAFVSQTGLVDAVGRRMRELAPAHEAHWFERYGRVARTGENMRFEAPARALGRWYEVYAYSVGAPGEWKVAVLFRDATQSRAAADERERLLAELKVERARLYQVFDRAPSFIVAFRGPDQVYEFVNDSYYQLVGHREVIGKPLLEAIPEIRGQGFKELLDQVRETGEPWVGHEAPVELQRTPGAPLETRYLDMVFQALTDADGTRSGVVAHGSDVTEQVRARREVERLLADSERARGEAEAARAEAEAANRGKAEFLATMSHELRTPLNAIGGYAELLEMGIRGAVTPEQREDLHRIQQSQRHLLGLINEVLNYAKLETGSVRYNLEAVPLREALAAAESLVAPQARAKGITLAVAECGGALAALADAEKLRQVLVNLAGNAVKFTDRGGRVDIVAGRRGREVAVQVRDTGIGIPPDKVESIFDPFVQVRSDLTRPHEGTGLGLAISRDLARGMGGNLGVESTPGVGSTFTLTLPAA